ncbi:DNA polymerase III subunit alpha [Glaciecola punicea ACAM 611]|uniref:DNA polymerase III subunit alpha n=1 Tax=Glaciecola punicea ACAM 611 TaxID=1121923 RepID=H5TB78_9ALTE|nr:DNA polymerase III subunit alpha [Glaciecola punicea]GAB55555.1 DNA polymerase III subunit alpha [Glaciecola punicea ACAM 611]
MTSNFVHLRLHSDFSMQDGLNKVKPILEASQNAGSKTLALTDLMNMCGLVKFYSAAKEKGIKPLVGCDIYLLNESLSTNKSASRADSKDSQIVQVCLLAMNEKGYRNITNCISDAYLQGHIQHKVVVTQDILAKYSEGVIVLSGAMDGDVGIAIASGKEKIMQDVLSFYQKHFADRFYIELQRTGHIGQNSYIQEAVALAAKNDLPVVATNNVRFLNSDDFEAHEVRVCISEGFTLDDTRRVKRYTNQQYLRTPQEMISLFSDIPEAIENSVEIAKRCNVKLTLGEYFLPNFPTGDMTVGEFLVKESELGLERRLAFLFPDEAVRLEKRPEYDDRLKIELKVINQMGFPGYFLIVMEFIQWSKDNNIPVGPGRGSGAGSLVAYALDITDLDPLEFDLLFERFLNPERVSMPDFDIDFCMDRRDEVIDHVAEIYGRDAVSQIITFGTLAAKAVIRDVGRVMSHPYGFVDRISKMIPGEPGMTLAKAFEVEPRLPALYEQDEDVKELIDMARILEGVTRNAGKHAGGVVISPTTITDFSPLYCDDTGANPVTQFDKNDVETAGLVKFDFLGLRTLTIIQNAIDMVQEVKGIEIDIATLPLDDKKSFSLLKRAETTAVFQLESRGMKDLIKRLTPDVFEEIIALVALFRPGPLQSGMVDNFIDRKHGREAVSFPDATYQHACLQEILEPTYGIILYQEQVMQIAQVMSGYSLGAADLLRRAMGKKNLQEMEKQRSFFKQGAIDNDIDPNLAMKIFDLVEKFAGYGFNKSHSAAYALVSYQTLWLKAHYPSEFMAAVLSADMDNTEKVVTLIDECSNMGIKVLPPDLNSGQHKFTVDQEGAIVYGIGAIKGVGEGPVEAVIEARQAQGLFADLFDFCAKVDLKKINRRVLEKLIMAGALDKLGPHRAALSASLKEAMNAASQNAKATLAGQSDMFGMQEFTQEQSENSFQQVPPWPERVWLDGEKETLGLYLTGHPMSQYISECKHYTDCVIKDLVPARRDVFTTTAGLIYATRVLTNKQGRRWALVTLDDKSARMEMRVSPDIFERYEEVLSVDKLIWIKGQVSFDRYNEGTTMNITELMTLVEARNRFAKRLTVNLLANVCSASLVSKLQDILYRYKGGTCPLHLKVQHPDVALELQTGVNWSLRLEDELMSELKHMLGDENVHLAFS